MEESMVRKLPAGVTRLKISAKNLGLGVFRESMQGMRKATGRLPSTFVSRSTQRSKVDFALGKSLPPRRGQGWSMVWVSRLSPSLSQV